MALISLNQMAFRFSRLTKRVRFALILLAAVVIAVAASLVVRSFMGQDDRKPITLALVGPLSGSDAAMGQAMRRGALLRVDAMNAAGGIANRPVVLKTFDDEGDPTKSLDIARRIAREGAAWAVLGQHPDTIVRAAELYAAQGIPLVSTRPAVRPTEGPVNPWLFHLNLEKVYETRFLANYVRNVVGEPTVAIVREDTEQAAMLAAQFDRILQRFGTKLVEQWTFRPGDTGPEALEPVARAVKEKMPAGAVVLLGNPVDSARMVVALRDAGLRNLIAGPSEMGMAAFRAEIVARARTQAPEAYGHGLLVSSPILFDTANERAQRFYGQYEKRFSAVPDSMAALGYDGADLILEAVSAALRTDAASDSRPGQALRGHIADHDRAETAYQGNVGTWTFDARGAAGIPVMMATYNGLNPVAALTQLQPIREIGVSNFLEEVSRGRALYVNDRFMYKTDVIYTGVQLNEVRALNPEKNEATLNLTVWFRYRGSFNPADVVFVNALKPIELGQPYREERGEVTTYVAYRVEEQFSLNFADVRHPHGSQVAGLSFRHRTLNRNNVMFVTDVLGMSLVDTGDFVEKLKATAAAEAAAAVDPGWGERFRRMLDGQSEASTLLDQLRANRVMAGSPGWRLSRAWISQDVVSVSSEGDPNYVGFGRPLPDFSRVDFGVIAVPDALAARDIVGRDFFVFFAIFGLVLAIFAAFMDRKDRGQFWRIQTLFMRMASWPLLLMATGNIALDAAVENLPGSGIRLVEQAIDALWWIVPAILVTRTMERFLWTPLEIKSQRKIPNIVRGSSTLVVFGLAICGIVAFVLKQPITSLLAASGLVGMVIGLAIQANIANVFSGIILNLERPFKIGDAIQITDVVKGEVIDMTWRTVRVRNAAGYTVAMPNAKVSEATVINFSSVERVMIRLEYHAEPRHEPGFMAALLWSALRSVQSALPSPTGTAPFVRYDGTRNVNGQWLSKYALFFWVQDHDASFSVPELVWRAIYRTLAEKGIDPAPNDLLAPNEGAARARLAIAKDAQSVPA